MPFCWRLILLHPLSRQYREEGGGAVVAKKDDSKQNVGVFQCILINPMVLQTVFKIHFFEFQLSNIETLTLASGHKL
jgi:hypothetical protein